MHDWGAARCARALLLSGALVLPVLGAAEPAAAAVQIRGAAKIRLDIPAQGLAPALSEFARQSGQQLLFSPEIVKGKRSTAISGEFTAREALMRLLAGTGIRVSTASSGAFLLTQGAPPGNGRAAGTAPAPGSLGIGGALAGASPEITVTGTRIRGGATPSPVVTISSEQIRQEGFSDLGDVIRSLPQNFAGGQNPGIAAGATGGGRANQNITGGSGLNLRGLGPDASLTLLNGRRLPYDGFAQTVDISAIPVDAVSRIEILTDGASAIYGSDAVGGVANIILKRDFDGIAVSARYGAATDGGLETQEYTATAGATWSSGGFIAALKTASNDPIYSDQRDYTEAMYAPSTLYQRGKLRSGLLSAHQALSDSVEIRLDALRSRRKILTDTGYAATYERNEPETNTRLVSPSVELSLPHRWLMTVGGTWGKSETDAKYTVVTVSTGSASLSRPHYRNKTAAYELGAEGPVFAFGASDVRLAVGAGYRRNEYLNSNLVSGTVAASGKLSSRFAYAELNVPLIGPGLHIPAVRRLTLTGALRTEKYDSFGSVTTPKLGLIYSPGPDLTLKASWGKSFKVPTLGQQFQVQNSILFPAFVLGGSGYPPGATALYFTGGNPDLKPERAKSWSSSLAVHPRRLPGLQAELTWFDIDYTDRVVAPLVPTQALSNPAYAPFVGHNPTAAELAAIIAASSFINATGTLYDPRKVVAIASNIFINTAREHARGLDLSGSYRFDAGEGGLTIRGALSWLDIKRQISSAEAAHNLSGTLFYPAKLSGRVGAVWTQGGFTAALFGNYRGGVTNTADGRKGGSFTTFDTALQYDMGQRRDLLSNVAFAFSAQNLFDRAPPLYSTSSPANAPYDSTNYSAVGRYLSLSISKRW